MGTTAHARTLADVLQLQHADARRNVVRHGEELRLLPDGRVDAQHPGLRLGGDLLGNLGLEGLVPLDLLGETLADVLALPRRRAPLGSHVEPAATDCAAHVQAGGLAHAAAAACAERSQVE